MANIKNAVKLGVFTLAIMNVTAVVSLRGLPAEAVYGMSSAFYYLFAAIVFLIPTSLVAAELAAMFQDKQGGLCIVLYIQCMGLCPEKRVLSPFIRSAAVSGFYHLDKGSY